MKLRLRKYFLKFEPLPFRQPLVRTSLILSLLFLGLIVFLLIGRLLPLIGDHEFVVLHYNVYVGVDRVGHWSRLLVMPIIGLIAGVVNVLSASWWWERERMLALYFLIGTVVIEFTMAVASLLTVLVNL